MNDPRGSIGGAAARVLVTAATAAWSAVRRFLRNDGPVTAAALAYYGLFSLFPLALVTLAFFAYALPQVPVRETAVELAARYLPGAERLVRENIAQLIRYRSGVGLAGLAFLLWAASSVFAALTRALGRTLGPSGRRSPVRARLLALAMVVLTALLLAASVAVSALLAFFARRGLLPADLGMLAGAGGFALIFCAILATYRLVPRDAPPLADLWPGAVVATAGLYVARAVFVGYLISVGRYQLIYGSVGAVIVALLWFYVSAAIVLFGAEFSAALRALRRG